MQGSIKDLEYDILIFSKNPKEVSTPCSSVQSTSLSMLLWKALVKRDDEMAQEFHRTHHFFTISRYTCFTAIENPGFTDVGVNSQDKGKSVSGDFSDS